MTVASPGQVVFQRLAFDKIHHHIPISSLDEIVINTGQIRMLEPGQQKHFLLKVLGSLRTFLRAEMIMVHLFHCDNPITNLSIYSFISSSKTALPYLLANMITSLEKWFSRQMLCFNSW